MKTLDATFKSRLQGAGSTLARIVDFTLLSGAVLRFTDSDRSVTYGGNVYAPGCDVSQVQAAVGASTQSCTVTVTLGDSGLTTTMIEAGLLDNAKYVVRVIDFVMPTLPPVIFFLGFVSKITYNDRLSASIDGRPLSSKGVPLATDKFSSNCRADLGDSRCKVNVDALKVIGVTVTVVTNTQNFSMSNTGAWSNGLVVFTSGVNIGYSFEIAKSVIGAVILKGVMPFLPAVGDTLTLYPGCDKTTANCSGLYGNIANFQGEPFSIAPYTASTKPVVATPPVTNVAAAAPATKKAKPVKFDDRVFINGGSGGGGGGGGNFVLT